MARMPSIEFPPDSPATLESIHRATLLGIAYESIRQGVAGEVEPKIDPENYHPVLREMRGTFVTLYLDGNLRGCIGSLEPRQTLVEDVSHNAWAAAFSDPRFAPLQRAELDKVSIEIAILSPLHEVEPQDEPELLALLEPQVHGLLIEDAGYRATFLPKVWEAMPDKQEFLTRLRLKAGLPADYWSNTLRTSIYTVLSFQD